MLIGIDCSRAFGSFFGGPESYSYNLIRSILKLSSDHFFRLYLNPGAGENPRFRPFFSGLGPSSSWAAPGSDSGVPAVPRMTSRYELKTISWKRLWTQGGLALECLKNPPDVLFVPAHTLPIIYRHSLKTVVTIHDLGAQYLPNYHKFPQKYYLNSMTEYAVKKATKIIAVSEYTKKDIIEKFSSSRHSSPRHSEGFGPKNLKRIYPSRRVVQDDGEVEEKIHVVYEGFDRGIFYPRNSAEIEAIKKEYGITGDYFLFVGTIQPRKNLVRLIEAFSVLIRGRPPVIPGRDPESRTQEPGSQTKSGMTLVLAGAPGWLNEEIYAAPKKYGVEARIKFLGAVENSKLAPLICGCAAFVFPSLFEGFGLAPLEALACGAPTILSNTTSLPEVGGEAAFYVDPDSTFDITEKMEQVLALTEEEKQKVGAKSLEQADKFSWEKAAQETLKVIEETSLK